MARDWLWELEARGLAIRVRGPGKDLLIVRSQDLEQLSPSSVAALLERSVAADPRVAEETLRLGAALQGKAPGYESPAPGGATGQADTREAVSSIGDAVNRGALVALRIRRSDYISQAEIDMLEAKRGARSVPAPPLPPRRPPVEEPLRDYPIRVVDDTGAPVAGVRLKLEIEGTPKMPTTDATGLALARWFSKKPASVRILDQAELEKRLAPKWATPPSSDLPSGPNAYRLGAGQPFAEVKAPVEQETTLILCRQASNRFEVIAYDGMGQVLPGVDLLLTVDGGEQGLTTDDNGVAVYEAASADTAVARVADPDAVREMLVQRALAPPSTADAAAIADAVPVLLTGKSQDIALKNGLPTKIVLQRRIVRVRLIGMHFDHAKCFLLPSALDGLRKLHTVYAEHPDANLLIVGHTDTRHNANSADKEEAFNRQLSLDRAKAVAAYLRNDVDAWYPWYSVKGERCWGTAEDVCMLSNVPHGATPYCAEGDDPGSAMKRFQADQGLPTNIGVGERTRRALIRDYMDADGTTLPDGLTVTVHGCGPYFPATATGSNSDVSENRRVEIFVFDGPIVPPPAGDYSEPGSPEYPAWVAQVQETVDFSTETKEQGVAWVVQVPEWVSGTIELVVADTSGADVLRIPIEQASPLEDGYVAFDLSALDPFSAQQIELRADNVCVLPPVQIGIEALLGMAVAGSAPTGQEYAFDSLIRPPTDIA